MKKNKKFNTVLPLLTKADKEIKFASNQRSIYLAIYLPSYFEIFEGRTNFPCFPIIIVLRIGASKFVFIHFLTW